MRIFGLEIRRAEKALNAVSGWRDGWRRIMEPFTGAWQQNCEEKQGTLLCYPTLYACLDSISSDVGKLPFTLQQLQANGIWKYVENPAYSPVLRKPNHYQTQQQFRESWIMSKLIHGNTYVLKGRDERGVVTRLYVLDPSRVLPMVSDTGDVFYQLNYPTSDNLLPRDYPAENIVVPAREIIHDRLNTFHHQLIGVPPVCAAHWPAVKNMKILRNATTFFANGANPGGILTAPAGMSETDAAQVRDYWNSNFQGENSGKVAVIGADMKFTAFAFKSADSQMVEQMRYSDEQICQPFGIPPFIVGIGSIPAGMKVDDMMGLYYQRALQKHIEAMENLLDEGLGISRPLGVELDLEPLLRMDPQRRAEVWGKLTNDGIAAPNEARLPFNLPPLEGGDTVYMQQQDFPLDQVRLNKIAQPEAPQPEVPEEPEQPDPEEQAAEQTRALLAAIEKRFAEA
jgi:HK97 family phage portal protein